MRQPIIVSNSPQQHKVDLWHLKICEKFDTLYPETGHFQAYVAICHGNMSVFVCVYVLMLRPWSAPSVRSLCCFMRQARRRVSL